MAMLREKENLIKVNSSSNAFPNKYCLNNFFSAFLQERGNKCFNYFWLFLSCVIYHPV